MGVLQDVKNYYNDNKGLVIVTLIVAITGAVIGGLILEGIINFSSPKTTTTTILTNIVQQKPLVAFVINHENLYPHNYSLAIINNGNSTIDSLPFELETIPNTPIRFHILSGDITSPYPNIIQSIQYFVARNLGYGGIYVMNISLTNQSSKLALKIQDSNINYCNSTISYNFSDVGVIYKKGNEGIFTDNYSYITQNMGINMTSHSLGKESAINVSIYTPSQLNFTWPNNSKYFYVLHICKQFVRVFNEQVTGTCNSSILNTGLNSQLLIPNDSFVYC